MLTLILPGGSVKNKEWALKTSKKLTLDHEVRPVLWEHWDNPEMPFDAKDKAQELVQVAMDESVNIVAKSIGTLVASYIIQAIPDRVEKLILCGIPLNDLTEADREAEKIALRNFPPEKMICFQNESDPHAGYLEVKNFLSKINSKIRLLSKSRSDHEYPYFEEFNEFLGRT